MGGKATSPATNDGDREEEKMQPRLDEALLGSHGEQKAEGGDPCEVRQGVGNRLVQAKLCCKKNCFVTGTTLVVP